MTETKIQEPQYYAVTAQLTDAQREEFYHAIDTVSLEEALAIVGTPIQPCADVETVAKRVTMSIGHMVAPIDYQIGSIDKDAELLVRRTDMEAQIAKVGAEKDAQIRHLETVTLPDDMTPDIERALGTICFRAAPYAHAFRKAGAAIPTKAEAEQAFVIFKLLKGVLQHGSFEKAADILLEEAHAAIKKAGKGEA